MKCKIDIINSLIKRAGTGVLTVFLLLFFSGLSWGETPIYVYQQGAPTAANTSAVAGVLTINKFNITTNLLAVIDQATGVTIPKSCFKPELFWDADAGLLRTIGYDANEIPTWTATIDVDGNFIATAATMALVIQCDSSTTPSVVSGTIPANVACTSFGPYGSCTDNLKTRTGNKPDNCVDPLPSIPCFSAISCTWPSANDSNWIPSNNTCMPNQPQVQVLHADPAGCGPNQTAIQVCPPKTCTGGWSYGDWSPTDAACSPNSQQKRNALVPYVGSTPQGCTGGTPAQTDLTQTKTCSANPCTGGWSYTAWTPSDATCQPNTQQTRTAIAGTGTYPPNCTGGTPSATDQTQTKTCPSAGTYQNMVQNCAAGTSVPVTAGYYLYKFTVPKGSYTTVYVALNTAQSTWSEQLVVLKGGNVTKDDYIALMAKFTADPTLHSLVSMGTNNWWYGVNPNGQYNGQNFSIRNSTDKVITTANGMTTFTETVDFTALISAGYPGIEPPPKATHSVRFCYK